MTTKQAQIEPWMRQMGGAVGGFCSVLATHPLDTYRIRQQVHPHASVGIRALFKAPLVAIRSSYQGLALPLFGIVPIYVLCFSGYSFLLRRLPPLTTSEHPVLDLFKLHATAGTMAGVFALPLTGPGERLKILLQLSPSQSIWTVLANARQSESIWTLLTRGVGISLIRDCVGYGLWFGTYMSAKQVFSRLYHSDSSFQASSILSAGALAGVVQWSVILPLDALKTRLQSVVGGESRAWETWLVMLRQRALYKGYMAAISRAALSNAIAWLATEYTIQCLMEDFDT